MNKKYLLLIPLIISLASCKIDKDYALVNFNLNYEGATQFTQVVNDGQLVMMPTEPEREDYVFNGWYLDENCTEKFENFNQPLETNINLYASWIEYETLSADIKLERFLNKLERLTGNVSKSEVKIAGAERYFVPVDTEFGVYQEQVYNRYKDITTLDYYDENKSYKFASQQYFYDQSSFYNIYQDIEGNGKQNSKKTVGFDESKVENFLSIDFVNLYCGSIYTLHNYIKNGSSYDEIEYILNFNDTRLNPRQLNYDFKVETYYSKTTADGTLVEEIYSFDCVLQFIDGKINRSKIVESYAIALDGEYQMIAEYDIQTAYTIVDEFLQYEGTKFNPSDYK